VAYAPAAVARRRKKDPGPTRAINTRAPQRIAVPFIAFCEDSRFSYWEGSEELMRRAGGPDREQRTPAPSIGFRREKR